MEGVKRKFTSYKTYIDRQYPKPPLSGKALIKRIFKIIYGWNNMFKKSMIMNVVHHKRGAFAQLIWSFRNHSSSKLFNVSLILQEDLITYNNMKKFLSSKLQRRDCVRLALFLSLSREVLHIIDKCDFPAEIFLLALEGKGIIQASNVER